MNLNNWAQSALLCYISIFSVTAKDAEVNTAFGTLKEVQQRCDAKKLDLMPVVTAGGARYKLPGEILKFLAYPRRQREDAIKELRRETRNTFFDRQLISLLQEISSKPIHMVEVEGPSNEFEQFRYFFLHD